MWPNPTHSPGFGHTRVEPRSVVFDVVDPQYDKEWTSPPDSASLDQDSVPLYPTTIVDTSSEGENGDTPASTISSGSDEHLSSNSQFSRQKAAGNRSRVENPRTSDGIRRNVAATEESLLTSSSSPSLSPSATTTAYPTVPLMPAFVFAPSTHSSLNQSLEVEAGPVSQPALDTLVDLAGSDTVQQGTPPAHRTWSKHYHSVKPLSTSTSQSSPLTSSLVDLAVWTPRSTSSDGVYDMDTSQSEPNTHGLFSGSSLPTTTGLASSFSPRSFHSSPSATSTGLFDLSVNQSANMDTSLPQGTTDPTPPFASDPPTPNTATSTTTQSFKVTKYSPSTRRTRLSHAAKLRSNPNAFGKLRARSSGAAATMDVVPSLALDNDDSMRGIEGRRVRRRREARGEFDYLADPDGTFEASSNDARVRYRPFSYSSEATYTYQDANRSSPLESPPTKRMSAPSSPLEVAFQATTNSPVPNSGAPSFTGAPVPPHDASVSSPNQHANLATTSPSPHLLPQPFAPSPIGGRDNLRSPPSKRARRFSTSAIDANHKVSTLAVQSDTDTSSEIQQLPYTYDDTMYDRPKGDSDDSDTPASRRSVERTGRDRAVNRRGHGQRQLRKDSSSSSVRDSALEASSPESACSSLWQSPRPSPQAGNVRSTAPHSFGNTGRVYSSNSISGLESSSDLVGGSFSAGESHNSETMGEVTMMATATGYYSPTSTASASSATSSISLSKKRRRKPQSPALFSNASGTTMPATAHRRAISSPLPSAPLRSTETHHAIPTSIMSPQDDINALPASVDAPKAAVYSFMSYRRRKDQSDDEVSLTGSPSSSSSSSSDASMVVAPSSDASVVSVQRKSRDKEELHSSESGGTSKRRRTTSEPNSQFDNANSLPLYSNDAVPSPVATSAAAMASSFKSRAKTSSRISRHPPLPQQLHEKQQRTERQPFTTQYPQRSHPSLSSPSVMLTSASGPEKPRVPPSSSSTFLQQSQSSQALTGRKGARVLSQQRSSWSSSESDVHVPNLPYSPSSRPAHAPMGATEKGPRRFALRRRAGAVSSSDEAESFKASDSDNSYSADVDDDASDQAIAINLFPVPMVPSGEMVGRARDFSFSSASSSTSEDTVPEHRSPLRQSTGPTSLKRRSSENPPSSSPVTAERELAPASLPAMRRYHHGTGGGHSANPSRHSMQIQLQHQIHQQKHRASQQSSSSTSSSSSSSSSSGNGGPDGAAPTSANLKGLSLRFSSESSMRPQMTVQNSLSSSSMPELFGDKHHLNQPQPDGTLSHQRHSSGGKEGTNSRSAHFAPISGNSPAQSSPSQRSRSRGATSSFNVAMEATMDAGSHAPEDDQSGSIGSSASYDLPGTTAAARAMRKRTGDWSSRLLDQMHQRTIELRQSHHVNSPMQGDAPPPQQGESTHLESEEPMSDQCSVQSMNVETSSLQDLDTISQYSSSTAATTATTSTGFSGTSPTSFLAYGSAMGTRNTMDTMATSMDTVSSSSMSPSESPFSTSSSRPSQSSTSVHREPAISQSPSTAPKGERRGDRRADAVSSSQTFSDVGIQEDVPSPKSGNLLRKATCDLVASYQIIQRNNRERRDREEAVARSKAAASAPYYYPKIDDVIGGGKYKVVGFLGRGSFGVVVKAVVLEPSSTSSSPGPDSQQQQHPQGAPAFSLQDDESVTPPNDVRIPTAAYDPEFLQPNQTVAIKISRKGPNFLEQGKHEVFILERLYQHQAKSHGEGTDLDLFVRALEVFYLDGHFCIVFELLADSLFDLMKYSWEVRPERPGLSLRMVRKMTHQLICALMTLRNMKMIHCDLKPENIALVQRNRPRLKLLDFGSSCSLLDTARMPAPYIQSRYYRAPEILLGSNYSCAIDMWSLGCIIVELYLGRPIFEGANSISQLYCIIEVLGMPSDDLLKNALHLPRYFSRVGVDAEGRSVLTPVKPYPFSNATSIRELIESKNEANTPLHIRYFTDLVSRMLEWDPSKRITPIEAVNHNFILYGPKNGGE